MTNLHNRCRSSLLPVLIMAASIIALCCSNVRADDVNDLSPTLSAGAFTPNPVASGNVTRSSLSVTVAPPEMFDPEASLNAPEYTYYVDSVKSCSTPDGTFIEASSATYQIGFTDAFSPSPYTSSSSGPLVFQPSGLYWKVTVHAKVRIGEVSAEDPDVVNYHVGTTPPVTLTVSSTFMTLDSITVISGAVQTNVIQGTFPNWACVKSATGTVIVEATTGPNNDSTEWANINWGNDGGSPVPQHANERSYSASTSTRYEVNPAIAGGSYAGSLQIWVAWGSVEIATSGSVAAGTEFPRHPNAPSFLSHSDGTDKLGGITYDDGTVGAGKVCVIGTLTPTGVGQILTNLTMPQMRMSHDLVDGAHSSVYWDATWTGDGPSDPTVYNYTPDSSDQIFSLDGPAIFDGESAMTSYNTTNNFTDTIWWGSQVCGDVGTWCYRANWSSSATPQITLNDPETGSCTLNQ